MYIYIQRYIICMCIYMFFCVYIYLCPTLCNPMDCSMPGSPGSNSWTLLKQTHVHWVSDATQPSHLLCHPLLLLPSIFLSIRVVSNESALHIRWPKYWSFSFNISPSDEYSGPISFRMDLQSKGISVVFSNTTVQKHQFFNAQFSL